MIDRPWGSRRSLPRLRRTVAEGIAQRIAPLVHCHAARASNPVRGPGPARMVEVSAQHGSPLPYPRMSFIHKIKSPSNANRAEPTNVQCDHFANGLCLTPLQDQCPATSTRYPRIAMFSCITLALRGAEISLQLCGDVRGSIDRALRRSFIFKLHRRDCCSLRSAGDDRRHSQALIMRHRKNPLIFNSHAEFVSYFATSRWQPTNVPP